ncbi:PD-(D/E)XK nuclease-like domain-containing protein [Salinibacter altiplanensis]|uniref:PD-(D/E)XK nuclease-like domain-containing protein n=1 Tax=Salinibacter altiplanensis TaxID=1803181 RepID=UPI000C9F64D5|nr:PD-(D/E)XK nuclease-like domain-containing protein [Salinibacter altiplanensis]
MPSTTQQNALFQPPVETAGAESRPKKQEATTPAEESLDALGLRPASEFAEDADGAVASPGLYRGVPEELYHAHPALSRSVLAEAARMSPMHARYKWRGGDEGNSSDATSLGTALHSRVLQPGVYEDTYDVALSRCEATKGDGDRCTYSAKVRHGGDWYCGTHAPDGEPDDIEVLKADTAGQVERMAEALEVDPDAAPLLFGLPGASEVTALWQDEATGLMCKARPDRIIGLPDGVAIVDVKTTRSAHPEDFRRKMAKYGYWLQPPFYTLGIRQASEQSGNAEGVPVKDFVFACVESSEPYATQCFRPHPREQQAKRTRMAELIDRVAECEQQAHWPSYETGVSTLGLKRYEKERMGISAG